MCTICPVMTLVVVLICSDVVLLVGEMVWDHLNRSGLGTKCFILNPSFVGWLWLIAVVFCYDQKVVVGNTQVLLVMDQINSSNSLIMIKRLNVGVEYRMHLVIFVSFELIWQDGPRNYSLSGVVMRR